MVPHKKAVHVAEHVAAWKSLAVSLGERHWWSHQARHRVAAHRGQEGGLTESGQDGRSQLLLRRVPWDVHGRVVYIRDALLWNLMKVFALRKKRTVKL